MLTGEIRSQIDSIWNAFWSGGISNPLEVIEQITYLLFLRRLDDLHILEENKAARLKKPIERRIFPKGKDARGRAYDDFGWSKFKNFAPAETYTVVGEHVFPFLRTLGRILAESGVGRAEDISRAKRESQGLGLFVRSLVGLDSEAARQAMSGFLSGRTMSANQIEFVNLIVEHLTDHGIVEAARLYESPFTDLTPRGPDGIFASTEVDQLLRILEEIRTAATAA